MATNIHTQSIQALDLLAARPGDAVALVCASPHQTELAGSEVVEVAELLGIDFAIAPFSVDDLRLALEIELEIEHECAPSMVDALDEDLVDLGTIAVANLRERFDYYTQLTQAHAPGDRPRPRHEHADVGTD
jgi:hypothetical protein